MERNKKAFYWIAEALELHPEMHDQQDWVRGISKHQNRQFQSTEIFVGTKTVSCGSAQCIAGWSLAYEYGDVSVAPSTAGGMNLNRLFVKGEELPFDDIGDTAAHILGLTEQESDILFTQIPQSFVDWPSLLRSLGDGEDIYSAIERHWLDESASVEEIMFVISELHY